MATSVDYIKFVCEKISKNYIVRYKKMFGEYMVYINEKPILLVCDNTVYVKKIEGIAEIMKDADKGAPYDGAKEHYILDIDDNALSCKVVAALLPFVALPKPLKRKKA